MNIATGNLFHPRTKLHCERCADLPVVMDRPQCVLIDGRVYVGGGGTEGDDDWYRVSEYSLRRDEWISLPSCALLGFAMGQFHGHLITVGGGNEDDVVSGRIYHYRRESRQWKEYLKPLPTARASLSIVTTDSAIIACGGVAESGVVEGSDCGHRFETLSAVEVYTCETDLWHTADPLPFRYSEMTSTTIADVVYLLGGADHNDKGIHSVLCASVPSIISKAVSRSQQPTGSSQRGGATCASVWKTLPDTPLLFSAAASLGGCLLALGGRTEEKEDKGEEAQSGIQLFTPSTNAWIKLTCGELPKPLFAFTAVQLSDSELLICGGYDDSGTRVKNVYFGLTYDS